MKRCKDCNKLIGKKSTRCQRCAIFYNPIYNKKGKNHGMYGKKHSPETIKKQSKAKLGKRGMVGKDNPMYGKRGKDWYWYGKTPPGWKGGITPLGSSIKNSFEYRQWRSDIFNRDDFTCRKCNNKGKYLQAHHRKPFALIMKENNIKTLQEALDCEELWNINNGLTLCRDCHLIKKHKWRKK